MTANPARRRDTAEALGINPLGAMLAVLGALAAIVSVFLPLVDWPSAIVVSENSLVDPHGESRDAALRGVAFAVYVLFLTYIYYLIREAGFLVIVFGVLLLGGAVADLNRDDYFTLTISYTGGVSDEPGLTDTIEGNPGIALYVTAAGGMLAAIGGLIMRAAPARTRTGTRRIIPPALHLRR
jgi:hypothetical protein